MKDDKSNEIVYTSVIYLNNIKELRKHLKGLNKKIRQRECAFRRSDEIQF